MFALGKIYYIYIPELAELGLLGALLLGGVLVLLFLGVGWLYDAKGMMWSAKMQVAAERNPYRYVPSPREFAFNYATIYAMLGTLRSILLELHLEVTSLDDSIKYLDTYFRLRENKKDMVAAEEEGKDFMKTHPLSQVSMDDRGNIRWGAKVKMAFEVRLLRLSWIQQLTGMMQEALVFGAIYVVFLFPDAAVGNIVPINYLFLGLILLSVVSGIIISGTISASAVISTTFISIIFLFGSIMAGLWLSPIIGRWVSKMKVEGMKIVTAFLFLFSMSYLADMVGLATIIGAFAAGLILDDVHFKNKREHHIEVLVRPLYCIFVPIFFVLMGAQVKLEALFDSKIILIALALTAAAIIGKQVCGLGVGFRCKKADRLIVGIGMIPRGEVGLIFAIIGKELGVINDSLFSAIIILVILTTLISPPLLKWSFARQKKKSRCLN